MEKVGDDIKASEKFAVMVTVSVFFTTRLLELSDKLRLGGVLSLTLMTIALISVFSPSDTWTLIFRVELVS